MYTKINGRHHIYMCKKNRDSIIGYRCKRKPVLIEGSLGVKLPIYGKIKQSSPTAEKRSSRV